MRRPKHPLRDTWTGLRQRCLNPRNPKFAIYGARGIHVCPDWDDFLTFVDDVGPKPSSKHYLCRKNVNGSYFPENCEWRLPAQQARNRRTNIQITVSGKTQIAKDWAVERRMSQQTICRRLRRGRSAQDAVMVPARHQTDTCSRGHPLSGTNLKARPHPNGATYFECRQYAREYARERRARIKMRD